jgi:hypothetical protein
MKTTQKAHKQIVANFWKGVGSIGNLWPKPLPQTNWASAWESVGDAFVETGDNMRDAMQELCDAERLQYPKSWR